MSYVRIIGAGLAGCEAALQLAHAGISVKLIEMKPKTKTPAQKLDGIAELVCSNSFRSTKTSNAIALLKDEMLLFNSYLMNLALEAQVPAGDALAVDREIFSSLVQQKIMSHKNIDFVCEEVTKLPIDDIMTIVATGPLTSDALAQSLVEFIGQSRLEFYDAISPIIDAESIDMNEAFLQSRWQEEDSGDYINCPLDKATYEEFVHRLVSSTRAKAHEFENAHYFEGCLPIEVMAERGPETLRFGPFKPVGLFDTRKKERPYAVLQLRKEDKYGSSFNMVGCQSRMTIGEQKEAFGLIPALKKAVFMRFASIHRNTYVNSPQLLDEYLRIKNTNIFLAGQITGVEGYVESMAMGLVVAEIIKQLKTKATFAKLPVESALGGLYGHVLGHHRADQKAAYMPSNVTWAMMPPLSVNKKLPRAQKRQMLYERGIAAIKTYVNYE